MDLRGKKRKHEDCDGETEKKTKTISILNFCDYILLRIFKDLSSSDLITMTRTCKRFARLAKDRSLWTNVDVSSESFTLNKTRKLLKFLTPSTLSLHMRGCVTGHELDKPQNLFQGTEVISAAIMKAMHLQCPQLVSLTLSEAYVNAQNLPLDVFPKSLKSLKLTGCNFINLPAKQSYFRDISHLLPNLEVLDLSHSSWLDNHSLMAISKCAMLKELRLRGCIHIGDCFVYTCLATRFGFQKLEVLDLRDTQIGDQEVFSFAKGKYLRELYLGSQQQFPDKDQLVSDKGLLSLESSRNPQLRVLVVAYCDISDTLLMHVITSLRSITHLDVQHTGVTSVGLRMLQKDLPSCTVIS